MSSSETNAVRTPNEETTRHSTNTQATQLMSGTRSSSSSRGVTAASSAEAVTKRSVDTSSTTPVRCINPVSEVNNRLDTQVEVKVYPCNNSQSASGKKKGTTFTVKPEVS
jgi:hypothetical protein